MGAGRGAVRHAEPRHSGLPEAEEAQDTRLGGGVPQWGEALAEFTQLQLCRGRGQDRLLSNTQRERVHGPVQNDLFRPSKYTGHVAPVHPPWPQLSSPAPSSVRPGTWPPLPRTGWWNCSIVKRGTSAVSLGRRRTSWRTGNKGKPGTRKILITY